MTIRATPDNESRTMSAGAAPQETGVLSGLHIGRILVPLEFSKCSSKALQYAVPFARGFGAELVLLHVIEPAVMINTVEVLPQNYVETGPEARQSLEAVQKTIGPGISSRIAVRVGSPHVEIVEAARELECDLIILSTHGRRGVEHLLLGSTAEKVVQRAGCPVLIVRESEREFVSAGQQAD